MLAAAFGAWFTLPALLHVPLILIVAMAAGAFWALIPAALKVTRGVHEVISTIMLNRIATGVAAYLLATYFKEDDPNSLVTRTKTLPKSAHVPPLNSPLEFLGLNFPTGSQLRGFLVVAVLAGIGFYVLVWRTRFGFDLRAAGTNPAAATASGVSQKSMVVRTMLLSGAIAGLVGMSDLLGFFARLLDRLLARARLRRHRRGAARAQPPSWHRRRAPCCGPISTGRRRSSTCATSPARSSRSCRASSCSRS